MNYEDAIIFLNKCINHNSEEYKIYFLGNPDLELAVKTLLDNLK